MQARLCQFAFPSIIFLFSSNVRFVCPISCSVCLLVSVLVLFAPVCHSCVVCCHAFICIRLVCVVPIVSGILCVCLVLAMPCCE